jgi:hypothetical protein
MNVKTAPAPLNKIPGYPLDYQASKEGYIWSFKSNKKLIAHINSGGYYQVNLFINGKRQTARLHRLLALAFIPNLENLPVINHKDGNKLNNLLSNLEWCTYSDNLKHAYSAGLNIPADQKGEKHGNSRLTKFQVYEIRGRYKKENITQERLAAEFRISREHCRDIINRKKWKHI